MEHQIPPIGWRTVILEVHGIEKEKMCSTKCQKALSKQKTEGSYMNE